MQLLSAEKLSKQYDDRTLFENISFGINQGERIGLIGVNGSGKSSLLKIIAGVESADSGQVTYRSGSRVAYLPQQPVMNDEQTVGAYMLTGTGDRRHLLLEYEAAVAHVQSHADDPAAVDQLSEITARLDAEQAWDAHTEVEAILSRLGITALDQKLGTLSGGQRRRVALAHALIEPADLLILDEPTNHLDADTVDWLETELARMPAALLLVTHDRYVLDRLVQRTWELDRASLHQYEGGYSAFLEQKLARAAQQAADAVRHTSVMRRELAWLRQGPQGRGTKQKARIERIRAMQAASEAEPDQQLAITLGTQRLGTRVLELDHVSKSYGDRTLLNDLSLVIERGERLGIVGPNGSGKSTLLNLLAGRDQPDTGEVITGETVHLAYYDQESAELNESLRVIDYVKTGAEWVRTSDGDLVSAADMLDRFLFPPRLHYAPIATLSGGERRRLYLLRTLMFAPNVLLLDEPSNDLDVQTLAALEQYLDYFGGTLIIASHDRYLLDRTVDHLLVFEGNGRVRTFPGSYSAYAAARRDEKERQRAAQPAATKTPQRSSSKKDDKPRTLSFKERKELQAIEARIAELEAQQAELNTRLSSGAASYDDLHRLSEALAHTGVELEQAFDRWVELSAIEEGQTA